MRTRNGLAGNEPRVSAANGSSNRRSVGITPRIRGRFKFDVGGLKIDATQGTGMREIRARFYVPGGELHDWGSGPYGMAEVCPLYVHRVEILSDDTVAAVVGFEGDHELIRETLEADDRVLDATVTAERNGLFLVQWRASAIVRGMLEARRQTSLAMQMPMALNADGSFTGTFLGDEETFAETIEYTPDDVEVEILRLRDVSAREGRGFDALTDRQREVLDIAVRQGYYDDPRGTTHEAIAAELDVAPTTVSEHLRRIERRIFREYEPRS